MNTTAIATALGGSSNIVRAEAVAVTRIRVQVRDPKAIDERELEKAGVGVLRISDAVVHVVVEDVGIGDLAAIAGELQGAAV